MKILGKLLAFLGCLAAVLAIVARAARPGCVYKDRPEEQNPMEGKRVRFEEDPEEKENAE